jgi:hypothetical protein
MTRMRSPEANPTSSLGEHRHQARPTAQLAQHLSLPIRGIGQNRVQGDDNRLLEIPDERQHVRARVPTKDPVLVLDQYDVGSSAGRGVRDRDVVGVHVLPDHLDYFRFGHHVVVAHDRHDIDAHRGLNL